MKFTTLILTGIFILTMLAPPAEAQRRRFGRGGGRNAFRTAAALGVIGAIAASSNRGYYGGYRGYGGYYGGGYYPRSYGYAPYYRSSYVAPTYATGLPFGAAYFVDEGDFRNYRDAYGRYLGRVPLWQVY